MLALALVFEGIVVVLVYVNTCPCCRTGSECTTVTSINQHLHDTVSAEHYQCHKIVFIAGLLHWIAMGCQLHIPCGQGSSAPGSDYSKTVSSPKCEVLISLSSPTWH